MQIPVKELSKCIEHLAFEELGTSSVGVVVDNVATLENANASSLVWIKHVGEKANVLLENCAAHVAICSSKYTPSPVLLKTKTFIRVSNPKLAIALIIQQHFATAKKPQIHPTAFIHESAQIGNNVSIGPFTYVGHCKIADNCVIHGNSYLHDGVEMHKNVEIHAGCIIGDIGSGYTKDEKGAYIKFPHIGGVVLEENVEVGALSYINRGAIGDTIIRKGAKIGNAVCIGHNVEIGENSLIIANTVVAGSTKVGKHVWVAHSSTIRNGIEIGDHAVIGMGAVVTKNVPASQTVLGSPAENIDQFKEWVQIRKSLLNR